MSVAIVTGASRGLGRALARSLAQRGWNLVIDARGEGALLEVARELSEVTKVAAIAGDVADDAHRRELVEAARQMGGLDLLVNNASLLGPSPQPNLADYPPDVLERVYQVNVFAPLRLVQLALPLLRQSGGRILNVTSDAGVEGYEGWGGYGSSKAALDHQTATWAVEEPGFTWYAIDPGDMRTAMHQAAYPDEDISDRPDPETVAPKIVELIASGRPSGRYVA